MGCGKCCSMFMACLFMFTGLGLLGTGIWMPLDNHVYDGLVMLYPDVETNPIVWRGAVGGLWAVGSLCIIAGILGMAATGCLNHGALIGFLVLGSIGTIASMTYGSLITARYITMSYDELSNDMVSNLDMMYTDENGTSQFVEAWNRYQVEFQCCGIKNYTDYVDSVFYNSTLSTIAVPWSCCRIATSVEDDGDINDVVDLTKCRNEAKTGTTFDELSNTGCEDKVIGRYKKYQIIILSICMSCAFLQIISLIASGCLKTNLKVDIV